MEPWWQTAAAALLGSGFVTLIATFALNRRLENFKSSLQAQLEQQKAFLQRATNVHLQQVDVLRLIHANLKRANAFFQRLTSGGRFAGETDERLSEGYTKNLLAASELCLDNELLIPQSIVDQLEMFFTEVRNAEIDLGFAKSPEFPSGEGRAKLFEKAGTTAFQKLPAILKAIETEARRVIHAELN